MKGTILVSIQELVINKHGGKPTWNKIAAVAGLAPDRVVLPISDIPDEVIYKIMGAMSEVLSITHTQVLEAFAVHFVCDYGPRVYKSLYAGFKDVRSFLREINDFHDRVSKNTPNAKPPYFDMQWLDERTLNMTYHSPRGQIDLAIAMVKATGIYFKEELMVERSGPNTLKVTFKKG